MKATPVIFPSKMKAERLDISPGRERGDSEFARKLDQADMNDTEGRIAHVESLQRPDEWKAATTSDGRTYYYNRKTRVSAWKVPFGGKLAAPSTSSLSSSSSSSRVPGDERQTKNTVVTQSSGLFCMFCGAAPARLGLSLLAHLDECQRCDLASEEVVDVVMKLAGKLGTVSQINDKKLYAV